MRCILGIISIAFLATSCASLKAPEFKSVENVQLTKFGFNESVFNLDLHYYNPNKASLKLRNAEGEAWVDETHLGHFIVDTLTLIPGKSDFVLPVKLQVELAKLLKVSALALLSGEAMVKIQGTARVGKGPVFINYPIKYEGKQQLANLLK